MSLRWITVALIAGSLICSKRRDLRWIIPCGALLAAATLGLAGWDRMSLTSGMSIHFNRAVRPDAELLFFQEDAWSGMTTVASSDGRRVLLRNGHSRMLIRLQLQQSMSGALISRANFAR